MVIEKFPAAQCLRQEAPHVPLVDPRRDQARHVSKRPYFRHHSHRDLAPHRRGRPCSLVRCVHTSVMVPHFCGEAHDQGVLGEVGRRQGGNCAAVDRQELAMLSQEAGDLVHDPARGAAHLVLRALADPRDPQRVLVVVIVHALALVVVVPERPAHRDLDRRAAAHALAQRDVRIHGHREALLGVPLCNVTAVRDEGTENVVCPLWGVA
mmetsp:Transcript_10806/g.33015  ORF Transcript_10806/g.33015 Transcript_10806/m.33015 type:complete len:209 (+) Transcript_10806:463-1089(+)